MNSPIIQVVVAIFAVGAFLALVEFFGGDVFRIVELLWEWIVSLVYRVSEFFMNSETFRRFARGPNG